jgi:hypothetical protein
LSRKGDACEIWKEIKLQYTGLLSSKQIPRNREWQHLPSGLHISIRMSSELDDLEAHLLCHNLATTLQSCKQGNS